MGGLSWSDYLDGFDEPWRDRFEELRLFLSENGLLCLTGDQMQNLEIIDKEIERFIGDSFSFRAWGDFLAAIYNDMAGEIEWDYMDFYYIRSPLCIENDAGF